MSFIGPEDFKIIKGEKKYMARADNITSLFGKSPIAPLQKHMKQAHSCLKDFVAFAKAADAQDWDKADAIRISINKKEEKADKL